MVLLMSNLPNFKMISLLMLVFNRFVRPTHPVLYQTLYGRLEIARCGRGKKERTVFNICSFFTKWEFFLDFNMQILFWSQLNRFFKTNKVFKLFLKLILNFSDGPNLPINKFFQTSAKNIKNYDENISWHSLVLIEIRYIG